MLSCKKIIIIIVVVIIIIIIIIIIYSLMRGHLIWKAGSKCHPKLLFWSIRRPLSYSHLIIRRHDGLSFVEYGFKKLKFVC